MKRFELQTVWSMIRDVFIVFLDIVKEDMKIVMDKELCLGITPLKIMDMDIEPQKEDSSNIWAFLGLELLCKKWCFCKKRRNKFCSTFIPSFEGNETCFLKSEWLSLLSQSCLSLRLNHIQVLVVASSSLQIKSLPLYFTCKKLLLRGRTMFKTFTCWCSLQLNCQQQVSYILRCKFNCCCCDRDFHSLHTFYIIFLIDNIFLHRLFMHLISSFPSSNNREWNIRCLLDKLSRTTQS